MSFDAVIRAAWQCLLSEDPSYADDTYRAARRQAYYPLARQTRWLVAVMGDGVFRVFVAVPLTAVTDPNDLLEELREVGVARVGELAELWVVCDA